MCVCVSVCLCLPAMRLRNYVLRTPNASRPSHLNETSGMTRTESTTLATPILNGRRGVGLGMGVALDGGGGGGSESKRASADNGRHLFINYQGGSADCSPSLPKKEKQPEQQQQQQQLRQPSPTPSVSGSF